MPSLPDLLQQSTGHAWLFVPTAILLGALHGLEPGHSKTLMAAFIVAIRGTVRQAVLLGLCAALSHTAVVWAVALIGQRFGQAWMGEAAEARLQLAAGALILAIGAWTAWQIRRDRRGHHDHDHAHHDADAEPRRIATQAGTLTLAIFEVGVPPRWRIRAADGPLPDAQALRLTTIRPDGASQDFAVAARDGFLESRNTIPEPHAFTVRLALGAETHVLAFAEHTHDHPDALDLGAADDAHARAHAADIQRRFAGRPVTTGQIMLFGLTGGLIPCPAAITVLVLCMQLKQLSLGFALVLCFGIGLALTLVAAGIVAALGLRHAAGRWPGLSAIAARAPYASAGLIVLVGLYTGYLGWQGLHEMRRTAAVVTP